MRLGRIERCVQNMKKFEMRYLRATKTKSLTLRRQLGLDKVKFTKEKRYLSADDRKTLQKKFANDDKDKFFFLDSLYDKYDITRLTHRISFKEGEIIERKL